MSEEEVIIQLTGMKDEAECYGYKSDSEVLDYAINRIKADRWIPVSERLPKKEGWYLVDRKECRFSIQYFFFDTTDHKPYWSGECKVYAWRPLPEPYKESEANT